MTIQIIFESHPFISARCGTSAIPAIQGAKPMKFTLQRVRLNSQGYANGGRHYYGVGLRLWWCMSDDGSADMYFRAADRAAAKDHAQSPRILALA
jgi:hypothetical protein